MSATAARTAKNAQQRVFPSVSQQAVVRGDATEAAERAIHSIQADLKVAVLAISGPPIVKPALLDLLVEDDCVSSPQW